MSHAANMHIQAARRAERLERAHRELAAAQTQFYYATHWTGRGRAQMLANATAALRDAEAELAAANQDPGLP